MSDPAVKKQISKVMRYTNALRSKHDWLIDDEPKSNIEVEASLQATFGSKSKVEIQQDKILITVPCGSKRISGPEKGSKAKLAKCQRDREEAFQLKRYSELPSLDEAIRSIESDLKKPIIKEPMFKVRCFSGFFIIDGIKYLHMSPVMTNSEEGDSEDDFDFYEG